MKFIKSVFWAVLTVVVLPLAKDYIETNYLHKPTAYETIHEGEKPIGAPAKR